MSTKLRTTYDEVPYDSHPFPQTHPDRLATIATLLGLRPANVERCRVLELGCAAGGNLIPMAASLPESRFVGIDLSRVQIEQGHAITDALGLSNIELRHQSILEFPGDAAEKGAPGPVFDYIICHGVFSWVPDAVQEKILDICAKHLATHGIAYISYNTYPGWHLRGMIRDMLCYHVKSFTEPAVKVKQARNLLNFLAKAAGREQSPYSLLLSNELESFHRSSDAYLYHEHLEDFNTPLYFHQFCERAAARGLKYLGEAELRVMVPGNFPPEIESVLQMLSQDNIHLEQYMDFLRNRMFRQTLLCHQQQTPSLALRGEQMTMFHVASSVTVERSPTQESLSGSASPQTAQVVTAAQLEGRESMRFRSRDGITLESRDPIVKAAMVVLAEAWPAALPFATALNEARMRLGRSGETDLAQDRQTLGQAFLTFYASASNSLLELHLYPPKFVSTVSAQPRVSALARLQARSGARVTNQRHESVFLSDLERHILACLDGNHDHVAVLDMIVRAGKQGELGVEKNGRLIVDPDELRQMLAEAVDAVLSRLCRNALLAG